MRTKPVLPCMTCAITAITLAFCNTTYAATTSNFNPDISMVLDGRFASYSNTTEYELPGFMLGLESEKSSQGFQPGHNELSFSSNIDDLFYGKLTTVIADHEAETEVELEEAFIETLALGQGLTIRAGRFYSDIGYLNNQHPHAWDFADAPLIYRGLFGNQLIDDGLHVSWLAPTDLYFKLGMESTRGERFPAGGAANKGKGAQTIFAKFGGDIGASHAWQLGFSHWSADIKGRTAGAHEDPAGATETPSFTGDSQVNGVDFVWKWAPNGNSRERNFKLQGEYFTRKEDGNVELIGSLPLESSTYQGEQKGWYLQTVYQFMPRWRIGYRYDLLEADNKGSNTAALDEAGLNDRNFSPSQSTLMVDYSHSEYSRIRLQYSKDDSYEDSDNVFLMQFIVTMGAHGAHRF